MPTISIQSLAPAHYPEAAQRFQRPFSALRQALPHLSNRFDDPEQVTSRLASLSGALAAMQNGEMVGYLGWWFVDGFRNTPRKGAYVPEWAHGIAPGNTAAYRALYSAASAIWFAAGCNVHAVTVLANDAAADAFWAWNGFGRTVVDAVRPAVPPGIPVPSAMTIRPATENDVERLAEIEAEHWTHYAQPPTLMTPQAPDGPQAFAELLADPRNSAWIALDGDTTAAYLRFESGSFGAAAIVGSETAFACTGAYTLPAYRGRGAAPAILDAAIRAYAAQGYTCATVDFESINPEASAFWLKYYQPVCFSMVRVPERQP